MRTLTRLMVLAIVAMVGASCSTTPTGRRQLELLPDSQMDQMGAQAFTDMKNKQSSKIERDPATNNYVRCVVDHLVPKIQKGNVPKSWEVVVFKIDEPNAFALPGGKIGVHTGLLKVATNADQLAAVIGHEIAHVLADHGNARVSETLLTQGGLTVLGAVMSERGPRYQVLMGALGLGAQFGVLLPHSRDQESEADIIGLDLMARAGFEPKESVQLWKNMASAGGGQPPEFLSTHPAHGTRIKNLTSRMPAAEQLKNQSSERPKCHL